MPVQVFPGLVQFVVAQREINNNDDETVRKPWLGASSSAVARCLFGVPDARESQRLHQVVEEEERKKREAFFRRYDLHVGHPRATAENPRKRSLAHDENEASADEKENSAKRLACDDEKPARVSATASHGDEGVGPRRVLQPRNTSQRQITDFWTSRRLATCDEPPQSRTRRHIPAGKQ